MKGEGAVGVGFFTLDPPVPGLAPVQRAEPPLGANMAARVVRRAESVLTSELNSEHIAAMQPRIAAELVTVPRGSA